MADYTQEVKDAYNDIKENGMAIVLKQYSPGTFSPASDSYAGSSWSSDSTYGLVKQYSHRFVDGTRIKVGDQQMLIPAYSLAFTLSVGDMVVAAGEDWEVIDPNPLMPGGTIILYKAQIRRAG